MSDHTSEQEETPTRVTDKRGQKKPPDATPDQEMPSAEQLLEQTGGPTILGDDEFARQAEQNANWDNLTDDEKQAILAQQAAELDGTIPFTGGGLQTEGETKKELLAVFVIEIDLDGTATAKPFRQFEPDKEGFEPDKVTVQRDVTARMMYRSCAEIMLDVEAAETSHLTLQMMQHVGAQAAAVQRAKALEQSLSQRGMRGRGGKRG